MVLTVNEKFVLRYILNEVKKSLECDGDGFSGNVPVSLEFDEQECVVSVLNKLCHE